MYFYNPPWLNLGAILLIFSSLSRRTCKKTIGEWDHHITHGWSFQGIHSALLNGILPRFDTLSRLQEKEHAACEMGNKNVLLLYVN